METEQAAQAASGEVHAVRSKGSTNEETPPESTASTVASAEPSDAVGTADTVEALREQLDVARAEKEEQLRAWQRTQADFVNYRRRVEQERSDWIKNAEASLIRDLLPVVDDLERALSSLPPELLGLTWVEGVALIGRKLGAILELHGVKPIEAMGKEFDPLEHDAVLRDGEPHEATVVTAELQKGYRLHDWVLRPTLVRVGPPANTTTG